MGLGRPWRGFWGEKVDLFKPPEGSISPKEKNYDSPTENKGSL